MAAEYVDVDLIVCLVSSFNYVDKKNELAWKNGYILAYKDYDSSPDKWDISSSSKVGFLCVTNFEAKDLNKMVKTKKDNGKPIKKREYRIAVEDLDGKIKQKLTKWRKAYIAYDDIEHHIKKL